MASLVYRLSSSEIRWRCLGSVAWRLAPHVVELTDRLFAHKTGDALSLLYTTLHMNDEQTLHCCNYAPLEVERIDMKKNNLEEIRKFSSRILANSESSDKWSVQSVEQTQNGKKQGKVIWTQSISSSIKPKATVNETTGTELALPDTDVKSLVAFAQKDETLPPTTLSTKRLLEKLSPKGFPAAFPQPSSKATSVLKTLDISHNRFKEIEPLKFDDQKQISFPRIENYRREAVPSGVHGKSILSDAAAGAENIMKPKDSVDKIGDLNLWIRRCQLDESFTTILSRRRLKPIKGLSIAQPPSSARRFIGMSNGSDYPRKRFLPSAHLPPLEDKPSPTEDTNNNNNNNNNNDIVIEGSTVTLATNQRLEKTLHLVKSRMKWVKPVPQLPKPPTQLMLVDEWSSDDEEDATRSSTIDEAVHDVEVEQDEEEPTAVPFFLTGQNVSMDAMVEGFVPNKPPSGRVSSNKNVLYDLYGTNQPAIESPRGATSRKEIGEKVEDTRMSRLNGEIVADTSLTKTPVNIRGQLEKARPLESPTKVARKRRRRKKAVSAIYNTPQEPGKDEEEFEISDIILNQEELSSVSEHFSVSTRSDRRARKSPPRVAPGLFRDVDRKPDIVGERRYRRLKRERNLIVKLSGAVDSAAVEKAAAEGEYDACLDHFYHAPTTSLSALFLSLSSGKNHQPTQNQS